MTQRVALVTGGSRGIGEAISIALQNMGAKVAANYAGNDEKARAFTDAHRIPTYKFDVSSDEACAEGVKRIEAELGPVDILVNNAGITRDAGFMKMTGEMWDAVIETNLSSVFHLCKAVFPGMRERKWGRIINISSINGQKGQFGQVNYSAAKAGLIGMTKALALEGARAGVTVNAVAPGYIATDMVAAMSQDVLDKIAAGIPLGRLGSAEDVARCVTFLAAEEAGWITGSTISVNGGQLMD
ncbi:MAG: acetoacetyl-CoA reductase [Sphingomonadaceae bacterium]|nr:acetoacetyl-CoA reductase [Sphingomonadaceae bacterium]